MVIVEQNITKIFSEKQLVKNHTPPRIPVKFEDDSLYDRLSDFKPSNTDDLLLFTM